MHLRVSVLPPICLTYPAPETEYAIGRSASLGGNMDATVAVIEDDPDILELVSEVLEMDGFQVLRFAAPDVRLITTSDPQPALFLIDLMLPRMNGVQLAERLRNSEFPHTPIIAMSASRLMLDVAVASSLFQAVMPKPFNLSALLSSVEQLIEERHVSQPAAL